MSLEAAINYIERAIDEIQELPDEADYLIEQDTLLAVMNHLVGGE